MKSQSIKRPFNSSVLVMQTVKAKRRRIRWKRWTFALPLALALPFLLLVRFSNWLYLAREINGWPAVLLSSVVAAVMLAAVFVFIGRKIGMRPGLETLQASVIILSIYCIYLLVYVSAVNIKSPDLRDTYHHLHPVLRISLSTFIVLDREAVITETERLPEDYASMGLETMNGSFHYEQKDGYVHAVDLRTRDRSIGRNVLSEWYFRLMGFSTLRHTGTADHLHVSLPVH